MSYFQRPARVGTIGRGLGFIPPQAFQAAFMGASSLLSSIGKGRREADVLSPIQNEMQSWLQQIERQLPAASPAQISEWLDQLIGMWAQFQDFAHGPDFRDGRASQQAITGVFGQTINGWIQTLTDRLRSFGPIAPPALTQGGLPKLFSPSQLTTQPPQSWLPPAKDTLQWLTPRVSPTVETVEYGGVGGSEISPLMLGLVALGAFVLYRSRQRSRGSSGS